MVQNGKQFPSLVIPKVGGGVIRLPEDLAGSYGVVLIYRGSWCPYCNAQLASFSRKLAELEDAGAKVVAFSVDDETTTAQLIDKLHLKFPVGYGADVETIARETGAYVSDDRSYLESTGFVLAPDGTVAVAVYSSGAIGRLVADDVIGLVRYVKAHAA
jgi:peroxiredoxin